MYFFIMRKPLGYFFCVFLLYFDNILSYNFYLINILCIYKCKK